MRRKSIQKMMTLLIAAVVCSGLCTDLAVNAQETDDGTREQTYVEVVQEEEKYVDKQEEQENLTAEGSEVLATEEQRTESVRTSVFELHAPLIEEDSGMTAGQKVTWDCVWFGSYPQSEVTSSDSIYSTLQKADGWDSNNDITINGNRYRRMKKGDATHSGTSDNYYSWSDADTYHYFKYEPIKWRVLKTDGNQALLLSDVVLDDRNYNQVSNTVEEDVTWETSTIRNWLNGYDSSYNEQETDCGSRNFISDAFTSEEQLAIMDTSVVNTGNLSYGTEGGNDTTDKIFLLSEAEVYGEHARSYGFVSENGTYDEARRSKSSTYAKAMGIYSVTSNVYKGNCWWWLRTPGYSSYDAACVDVNGFVYRSGSIVNYYTVGVRAALNFDLSSDLWSYAGTVSSAEAMDEEGGGEDNLGTNTTAKPDIKVSRITLSGISRKIAAGKKIKITAKISPSNASNKSVTWKSSNKKVAAVDSKGIVKIKTGTGGKKVTITAMAKDGSKMKASYKITSMKGVVKKVTISGKKSVKTGKSLKLTARVKATKGANKKLAWKSSNTEYATVTSSGKVKTKKAGKGKNVKITASATDGSGKKSSVVLQIE